jgi:hypothetical protein
MHKGKRDFHGTFDGYRLAWGLRRLARSRRRGDDPELGVQDSGGDGQPALNGEGAHAGRKFHSRWRSIGRIALQCAAALIGIALLVVCVALAGELT